MSTNRIILTTADIPADSDFTLTEWQGIVDAMYDLTTDELQTLKRCFSITTANL